MKVSTKRRLISFVTSKATTTQEGHTRRSTTNRQTKGKCSFSKTKLRDTIYSLWKFGSGPHRVGTPAKISNRKVLHAALHILKTGEPWRDLPRNFGHWNSVYRRYNKWCKAKVWERVLAELAHEQDSEWHSIDATIVAVQQDGCRGQGGAQKKCDRDKQRRKNIENTRTSGRARVSCRARAHARTAARQPSST